MFRSGRYAEPGVHVRLSILELCAGPCVAPACAVRRTLFRSGSHAGRGVHFNILIALHDLSSF
eukprot:10928737-Karenia_brevis.AAC.1